MTSQDESAATSNNDVSSFPIPASLHDLERAPYNLLPYPYDFVDDDEAARADSFSELVHLLEQGNRTLSSGGVSLFESSEQEIPEPWMDEDRVQALYTLVRKSASLAPTTRAGLVSALCHSVKILSSILDSGKREEEKQDDEEARPHVMSQAFRDAFACHLYMLFSIMFFAESEAKVSNSLKSGGRSTSEKGGESETAAKTRAACAEVMLVATQTMAKNRARLWKRGVPDEAVVILPCRIAFQMLETATGVIARKASSADAALGMIAATVDSTEGLLGTIVAALMDLMHSYEHLAPLCAEMCCMVSENPTNRLAVELLREIGRLKTQGLGGGDTGGRASGIRNVAPFISHLASLRPHTVHSNIANLMPHFDSEVHNLRSALVSAISNILVHPDGLGVRDDRSDLTKARASLLDILTDRVLDVSSFTRAAVMKAWIQIVQTRSLPVERFIPVATLAIDRLQDRTIVVRRQSMQLLTVLLENNPFMGNLDPNLYKDKLTEIRSFVKDNLPTNIKEAHAAALVETDLGDAAAVRELEEATLAAAIADADALDNGDQLTEEHDLFYKKVQALKYAQSALAFIERFESANDSFQGMLLSANSSDVTEALRFFVRARHFKLPCAITGMRNALALMWSTEQNIRDEVRAAFVEVFIAEPGTDGQKPLPEKQIAENLLLLVGSSSVSELASIEEAITCLVKDDKIPPDVFFVLWSVVAKGSDTSRAAAVQILSCGAVAAPSIIDSKSRLKLLLDSALGEYLEEHKDWQLARAASCALQRVARAEVDPYCAKYLVLEQIMEQLCAIARGDWCVDEDRKDTLQWFSAAEQAIKAIFVVSPCPEEACSEIIRGMYFAAFRSSDGASCHTLRLARFFHVLGTIALNLLVYTEAISSDVRRANAKKSLQKQVEADKKKTQKKKDRLSRPDSGSEEEEDAIEAELGIAAEVEAENERNMAEIVENQILFRGLISVFSPLVVRVVSNEGGGYDSEVLMQSAMLALCKFMCVSSSFCEKHLPLLFSALTRAPAQDITMRANTVVALGDLAFRFPNEVEPYTPHMYSCLRDTSTTVRRHTLMVLSHLILNDMVKVKGQVCEIALCLEDADSRIRDMAGLLFQELSRRSNNPIYNLLPDIISQLGQLQIERDQFRRIMVFLLGFIKKERQSTMLTEKLCQRFAKATNISQKADLAYCIAQLKLNDKAIKCLMDNFKLYKDCLAEEDVRKSFSSILSKAKKATKAGESRTLLDDFEAKLVEGTALGEDNKNLEENARKSRKKPRKPRAKKIVVSDGEDEETYEGTNKENRKVRSSMKNPCAMKIVGSDGEDEQVYAGTSTNKESKSPRKAQSSKRRSRRGFEA